MTELEKVSAVIGATDAEDLRWYFEKGGLNIFAGSPLGAMLDKMELFSVAARPCEDCGGNPEKLEPGTGFKPTKDVYKGATKKQIEMLALLEIEAPDLQQPSFGDCICPRCKGRGWVVPRHRTQATKPLTARPMGSSKKGGTGGGVDLGDVNMARLGHVSRKLDAVRAAQDNVPAVAALEAYYAPDSSNDVGSLWHLVPAGKTMLRGNSSKLHPNQFFQNLRAEQETNPSPNRQAQFTEAQEQATELFRFVCRLWNGAN